MALEPLCGDRSIQEIVAKHNVLPTKLSAWKKLAVGGVADVFASGGSSNEYEAKIKELHAKIERLAASNDF